MKRAHQLVLILSTLGVSWLGMMIVHEAGHVIGAWTSGGAVSRVVLHPLQFSWTEYSRIPHPLWTVWAGALFGVLIPLVFWMVAHYFKASFSHLLRCFAGFCLLANGAYLGVGAFERVADAGNLLDLGAPAWQLWLFGAVCMPAGLLLWHGIGPGFGLGKSKGRVNARHAYVMLALLVVVILTETLFALL